MNRDAFYSGRGENAGVCDRQRRACRKELVTLSEVFPCESNVPASVPDVSYLDLISSVIGVLESNNRVGSVGKRSTGHDSHRLAALQSARRKSASGNRRHDWHTDRNSFQVSTQ